MSERASWLLVLGAVLLLSACDSSKVDATDLHDVFEHEKKIGVTSASAKASAAASAAPRSSAKLAASAAPNFGVARQRPPVTGPCVSPRKALEPRPESRRIAKRPACRGVRMFEWRDPSGLPRYACVFGARKDTRLPLVLFFHGAYDRPTAVHKKTRLRKRQRAFDMTADPTRAGFVIMALQARRYGNSQRLEFSTNKFKKSNVDVMSTDHFVDRLIDKGYVDRRQIYAVGHGTGGSMAAMYSMIRSDRVAAFATVASDASVWSWSCEEPQPPAFIAYRSCDTLASCKSVEAWLAWRAKEEATTMSLRLGADGRAAASCTTGRRRCKDAVGRANHLRWPKRPEKQMLEFLSRYRLQVEP